MPSSTSSKSSSRDSSSTRPSLSRSCTSISISASTTANTGDPLDCPARRSSLAACYTSVDFLRSCAESMPSSYLCDDDLLPDDEDKAELAVTSSSSITEMNLPTNECIPPTYHCGQDDYRARKAQQELRRREAMKDTKDRTSNEIKRRTSKS